MIREQTFQATDLWVVLFLVFLEGLLSADNALVLALMVRPLAKAERRRALTYGLVGAFLFRGVALIFAAQFFRFWWLQAVGAAYLLIVALKYLLTNRSAREAKRVEVGFWRTVIAVEMTDLAFAVDSVVAAVAVVRAKDKLWVVFVGAALGIVLLRLAANFFARVIEKFPRLETLAYLLVLRVAGKLTMTACHNWGVDYQSKTGMPDPLDIPEMPALVFWGVMLFLLVVGTALSVWSGTGSAEQAGNIPTDGEEA